MFFNLSEILKAIKSVLEKFQNNETPFCALNKDNFRDITVEKVRYIDVQIWSFKLNWSFFLGKLVSVSVWKLLKKR